MMSLGLPGKGRAKSDAQHKLEVVARDADDKEQTAILAIVWLHTYWSLED